MKKYLIILSIFLSSIAYSQQLKLGFNSGLGIYNMKDLKSITTDIYNGLPFDAKVISNYPAFFYYKPGLYFSIKNFNLGIQASFNSTGSRISSKDYSGEYKLDTNIECIGPSVYVDYAFFSFLEQFKIMFSSDGGMIFSELSLTEDLTINDQPMTNISLSYKSQNYFVEPGFKIEYRLHRLSSIGLQGSYLMQFSEKVFESEDEGKFNYKGTTNGPNWSGLRIGATIMFFIPNKS